MIPKASRSLLAISIIEAVVIIGLLLDRTAFGLRYFPVVFGSHMAVIKTKVTPQQVVFNPIALALEYEAPDRKFEEVVKQHLGWLEYRPLPDSDTVLADCASASRTNYVRILIENGANVDLAVKDLTKVNNDEAIRLLKQVQSKVTQAATNSTATH
jgi:hypothetical protein